MMRTSLLLRAVLVATIGLAATQLTTAGATHVELIEIPVDQIVRGAEGDEVLVAQANVPEELVGLSCDVIGETENQRSVHPDNDLLIVLGDQTVVIPNFEDAGFVRHVANETAPLPAVVEVFVRLGPHGVSSGGFMVEIDCEDAVVPEPSSTTTTTTTSSTTTTTTTVAVSVPEATTTTTTVAVAVPEATTTTVAVAVPEATTTTTTAAPEATTTTTLVAGPEATTTVAPPATVSSAAPPSSQPPASTVPPTVFAVTAQEPEPPSDLAFTGARSASLAVLGLALVAFGAVIGLTGSRLRRIGT